ncbi:MAG: Fic family protein [Clostridia bacterium]|nr:Fic family protein [Clostridia bacterium]
MTQQTYNQQATQQLLDDYKKALDLLDDFDHQCLAKVEGQDCDYVLTYEECTKVIQQMRFSSDSQLFGVEKDDSFKSTVATIYQTAGGQQLYPTWQQKASHLLYFCTKNHSFVDGNKRIAATIFVYFLAKNNLLYKDGYKRISDQTLVALTVLIAQSNPQEKQLVTDLVQNLIN